MKPEYTLTIYPEKQLIKEVVKGDISMSELVAYQKQKIDHPLHNAYYNVLVDLRGVNITDFKANYNSFPTFMDKVSKNINTSRKCAVITSNPNEVVIAELFTSLTKKAADKINFSIFSTEEAALNWLGLL